MLLSYQKYQEKNILFDQLKIPLQLLSSIFFFFLHLMEAVCVTAAALPSCRKQSKIDFTTQVL